MVVPSAAGVRGGPSVRAWRGSLIGVVLAAAGCVSDADRPEVYTPGDIEFRWDDAFNDLDDGLAAYIPLDVMVLDPSLGLPLAGVPVTWVATDAAFADPSALRVGDAACVTCTWDAWRDTFVEVSDGEDGDEVAVVPFRSRTDDDGIARVYAVVDTVDEDELGFVPVRIGVHVGAMGASHDQVLDAASVRVLDLLPR